MMQILVDQRRIGGPIFRREHLLHRQIESLLTRQIDHGQGGNLHAFFGPAFEAIPEAIAAKGMVPGLGNKAWIKG